MAGKSAKEDKARVAQPTEDNNKRGFIKSILEKIFDEDDSDQPLPDTSLYIVHQRP